MARQEISVTAVGRLYCDFRNLTSDYPFSQRPRLFQVGSAHSRDPLAAHRGEQVNGEVLLGTASS